LKKRQSKIKNNNATSLKPADPTTFTDNDIEGFLVALRFLSNHKRNTSEWCSQTTIFKIFFLLCAKCC